MQRLFRDHQLGATRPKLFASDRKVRTKALLAAFDAMPRPKKPPGKR